MQGEMKIGNTKPRHDTLKEDFRLDRKPSRSIYILVASRRMRKQ